MQNAKRVYRLGVLSDTHHNQMAIQRALGVLRAQGPLDALCFLGDCTVDVAGIEAELAKWPVCPALYVVRGNNDLLSAEPDELLITVGGVRLLLVHGHLQRVKTHRLQLIYRAQEVDAQVALFGHTHQSECGYEQGILLLNPGAAYGPGATCACLTIESGILRPEILPC